MLQAENWFAIKNNDGLYKLYSGQFKFDSFSNPIVEHDRLTWSQVKSLQEAHWNPTDFNSYLSEQQVQSLKNCDDKRNPTLFVGKVISDGRITCQIIRKQKYNFHIRVLKIEDKYIARYLDVGKIYPVFKHDGRDKDLQIWEISGKRMKRSVSQLLLCWQKDIGWCWELEM